MNGGRDGLDARPTAAEGRRGYARTRGCLVLDDERPELGRARPVRHAELFASAEAASPDDLDEPTLDERDPHVIFFTSGSTGRRRGSCCRTGSNCLRSFPQLARRDATAGTVCMFPLFHMAGWSLALGAGRARRPIHFVRDARRRLAAGRRWRGGEPTRIYADPRGVGPDPRPRRRRRTTCRRLREADTGTSATPPELVAAIRDALPHTVTRIFYGSTEAGPGHDPRARPTCSRKPGSVGLPQQASSCDSPTTARCACAASC